MNVTEELVNNVIQTEYESIDEENLLRAKFRIVDTIGCALAGIRGPGCDMLLNLVKRWGGTEESTIIGSRLRAPAHNAAMMNSMMARSFDNEPVEAEGEEKSSPAHISGTTVPTALAVAETKASSGKDLITALIIGDDLAARLGVASGFDFNLGWDNTGTINTFAATAIASKLLGLGEKQIFNAFGIALNQLAGVMAGVYDKTLSFKLPIALSSRNGIFSAELAREGFTGVDEPFLGQRGYFSMYCRNYKLDDLTKDLGKRFYADCVIKPYSSCRATHPSIDCALQIAHQNGFKVEDIEAIHVETTPGTVSGFCGQPFTLGENPQVDAAFSIRYSVATALLRKDIRAEYFTGDFIRDVAIRTLIDKTRLVAVVPQEKAPFTRVRIETKIGQIFESQTSFPRGDFRKTPLTEDEISEKFRSNVVFSKTISQKQGEILLKIVDRLEDLDDVTDLVSLLSENGE